MMMIKPINENVAPVNVRTIPIPMESVIVATLIFLHNTLPTAID